MSRDPMAGKYQKPFKHEFLMAQLILKGKGGELSWSTKDYEAFTFTADGVRILFYPHKTSSTGNVQCRVRDHGSKNKLLARKIMAELYVASGHSVTFYCKGLGPNEAGDLAGKEAWMNAGWAHKQAMQIRFPVSKRRAGLPPPPTPAAL